MLNCRDRFQNSLLLLSNFDQIYQLLLPLQSLENHSFSEYFNRDIDEFAQSCFILEGKFGEP